MGNNRPASEFSQYRLATNFFFYYVNDLLTSAAVLVVSDAQHTRASSLVKSTGYPECRLSCRMKEMAKKKPGACWHPAFFTCKYFYCLT